MAPPAPRRRILWVSAETPDRFGQGGQRRQFHLVRELTRRGHAVTVLVLRSDQDDTSVRAVAADVRRPLTHLRGRRIPGARRRLHRLVARPDWDAVVLSHAESAWMLPRSGTAGALLVELQNVFSAWRAGLGGAGTAEAHAVEAQMLARADAVAVVSELELARLRAQHPDAAAETFAVPLGVDPDEWPDVAWDRAEPIVALFGSWGWHPNARGLAWFAGEVWPGVRAAVPDARALVAGGAPGAGEAWPEGLEYVGRVADLPAFTAAATCVVVPVVEGVGASVKFAEALATGAAVIATPDGASAFRDAPAEVSDDAGRWVEWIVESLRTRQERTAPDAARAFALTELTWARAADPLDRWLSALPAR